jgi:DNA-binding FadR family transcriptional regulator
MAIRDRDPAAARAAMAAHLDRVEHRLREHVARVARAP